jgi:hypothetical protein
MSQLPEMFELSGAELDAVTGGQAVAAGGLVNLALSDINVDILRNADINVDVIDDVTLRNIANNNNVGVGVLLNLLGGPAGFLINQPR